MQVITSKDNETVKNIKKLKDKKYRDIEGAFLIEGIKLLEEAINENADIRTIVICDECVKEGVIDKKLMYEIAKYDCIYVSEKIFNTITDVTNPQGILAVVNKKNIVKELDYNQELILILDGIQDPGNLGTILRTVDSVNLKQIVISNNSGDVYNPKVVRSTMGAIFRIDVIESDNLEDTIKEIKKHHFKVYSTDLKTTDSIYNVDYNKVAVVIGNEANGVSENVLNISDKRIKIPMTGKTESLNASVATGVILYEYLRRKI